jgi:hypothetical protein
LSDPAALIATAMSIVQKKPSGPDGHPKG